MQATPKRLQIRPPALTVPNGFGFSMPSGGVPVALAPGSALQVPYPPTGPLQNCSGASNGVPSGLNRLRAAGERTLLGESRDRGAAK